jgi:hypothetical protein
MAVKVVVRMVLVPCGGLSSRCNSKSGYTRDETAWVSERQQRVASAIYLYLGS